MVKYILLLLACVAVLLIHVRASNIKEIKFETETFAGTKERLIGDNFPAKYGVFSEIKGIAIDPINGDFFVGDSSYYVIRRIFATNGTITTYAGKLRSSGNTLNNVTALGNPIFKSVHDLAFHPFTYDLYVCDYDGGRILKIDRNTNIVTKVAGASTTTNASLALELSIRPTSVAFSPEGELHIGDEKSSTIMKITSEGLIISVAGTGATINDYQDALSTQLSDPFVKFYNGSMYIGEKACIRFREANNTLRSIVGICGSFGNVVGDASIAKIYVSGFTFLPGSNDILIIDGYFNRLKLFNATTNQVSTISGTGSIGNDGDGGPAIYASIDPVNQGNGIVATKDNIYFASNNKFRIISNNTISTISGLKTWTGHGLGKEYSKFIAPKRIVLSKQGDCYVSDESGGYIYKFSNGLTRILNYDRDDINRPTEGPIEKTYIGPILAITLDEEENILYSDNEGRIQKVINNQTTTTNFAKGANLKTPDGDLYTTALIANPKGPLIHPTTQELYYYEGPSFIRKISTDGRIVTILGDGVYEENGFANTSFIYSINHFTFTTSGDLIIVSGGESGGIYRVSNETGRITKITSAINALAVFPHSSGSFYVMKKTSSQIVKITGNSFSSYAHNVLKEGIFLSGNDTDLFFLINDSGYAKIRKVPIGSTSGVNLFGTNGSPTAASNIDEVVGVDPLQVCFSYSDINSIAIHPITQEICLSHRGGSGYIFCIRNSDRKLYRYAGGGTSTFEGVLANQTTFNQIDGFTFDKKGNLFIAEYNYKDSNGYGRIRKIDYETKIVTSVIGGFGDGNKATFTFLADIKGISVAKDGTIYVSTIISVRKISKDGIISTVSGLGKSTDENIPMQDATFNTLSGTSLDKDGNIYVVCTYDHVVRLINITSGLVKTIAGTMGLAGYVGDGGLAINAKLNTPTDVYVTSKNDVYITDTQNNVIRKVFSNGTIITFAGSGAYDLINGDPLSSAFNSIEGIAVRETEIGDEIYVADTNNAVVRRIFPSATCFSGYYGPLCTEFDCYGVNSKSNNVCSGNGVCNSTDVCLCSDGYFGSECDQFFCFGESKDNETVCSSFGSCIGPNNCSCDTGYFGENCEKFYCNGILYSNSTFTCSQHGSCIGPNNCSCNSGYFGLECQEYECFNIHKNLTSACNGNGSCVSPNNCSCNSGYYGLMCKEFECFGVHFSNSETCSNHGTCISPNNCLCKFGYSASNCSSFSCFGIQFNNTSVCSQHGSCASHDTCICDSGYTGYQCQYRTIIPKFLNDYSGITFNLDYSPNYDTLNCSKLVFYKDWPLLGTNPVCTLANKETNLIQIILGEGSTLLPNSKIVLNRLATTGGIQYENVTVLHADNPVEPVIIFSSLNETSPCESIVVDASKSYSGDRRPVIYNWKLFQNPSGLPILDFTEPIISINSSIAKDFGFYKFKLQIQSSISGKLSNWTEFSVYKSQVALPIISINGLSSISTTTVNVPFTIKKTIDLPDCYYEDTSHTIDWQLISGPIVSFYKDIYNNLVITNFTKGNQEYQFKITAISNVNTQSRSSSIVKVITVTSPLTLTTFSSDLTSSSIKINAEFLDEEQTNEIEAWNWSCYVLYSNSSCGNSITSALTQYSSNKLSIINLDSKDYDSLTGERPKLRIKLTISKGSRSVASFTDFQFSNLPILPPTVNLIQYYPTNKDIKSTDLFSLDLQVTSNGQTIDIEKYIIRQWKLNNVLLLFSDPVLNKMSIDPSTSNSIVLDASKLIQGSTNVISLNVTDIRNSQSALYSQEFRIIKPPIPCSCSVTPSSGVALETTFSFSCSNCQNEDNSIQLIYGFIDDKSGTYIPLHVLGETYSTKLPTTAYPLSNIVLDTFIKIVDTSTGASTEIVKKVSVMVPTAKTVTEVKKKVAAWSAYEKTLQNGDSTKMIFNSAVISRTSEAMIKNLASKKRGVCQNGGIYEEAIQKCICQSNFTKSDCSMSIIKQTQINELRSGLLDTYLKSFEISIQNELINENVLSLNAYGLDSLLSSFDELDDSIIEKSLRVLSTLLNSSLKNKKLSPVKGVETLLGNSLNSIFSFMHYHDFKGMDNYFTQLEQNSFSVGKVLLQSTRVGEKPVILTTLFNKVHATKLYRTGLSRLSVNFGVDSINFPANMPHFLSEKFDRKSITLITKSTNSPISSLLGPKKQIYNNIIGNNQTIISTQRKLKSLRSIGFDLISVQLENVTQPISLDMQLNSDIDIDRNKEKLISQYKSSTSQISNYSTISYSCMEQTETSLLETTACTLNIRNSTFVSCECVNKGFFIVVEHISERTEVLSFSHETETSGSIISKIQPNIISIVVPIVVIASVIFCVVALVVSVIGTILGKKKQPTPETETKASVEMANFSV